jgi:hypothetical protein
MTDYINTRTPFAVTVAQLKERVRRDGMNLYQIQTKLRRCIEDMTEEQLSQAEQDAVKLKHPVTGQTFCEIAAEELARGVKRNPSDVARIRRIAPRFPGLAQELLRHFPDAQCLKDIAEGWDTLPTPRNVVAYADDFGSFRDDAAESLIAIETASGKHSVDWLIAYAERFAPCVPLAERGGLHGGDWAEWDGLNPPERHLREERIDALASLLSLFAVPDAYAPDPVEHHAM